MSFKTTRKSIVNSTASRDLLSVGYCGLATLLQNHSPIAYTCGTYGWNFDVYEVYGLTICTGYRGMPGRKANNVREYEQKAKAIRYNYDIPWEQGKEMIENLLKEFCEQA